MNLRAFLVTGASALLVSALVACTGGLGSDDCGPVTCGACQSGFSNVDRCENGDWLCECVPSAAASQARTDSSDDAGADATLPPPKTVLTCEQKLANPMASGVCPADDWDKPCDRGCLSCRCTYGEWGPCTTNPSCFDAGTD